jgi:hypothetical protein
MIGETYVNDLPREMMLAGSVSAFLASVLFLIGFMGLQVSTSFVSSKIAEILSPLPLSKGDISNILFICFARIFDLPLITAMVVLPLVCFLATGSLIAGLIALVAVISAESFALALTIGMSRFFYQRVAGGGGRSKWKTLTRIIFMFVWILPTFGTYLALNFAGRIVESFAYVTQSLSSSTQFIAAVFPFSFGFLISYLASFHAVSTYVLILSLISSPVYVALALYGLRWVARTVRRIGGQGTGTTAREVVKDTLIHPQASWLGIIRKDLRIASRTPSYASLFLLPVMQTVLLAISFLSFDNIGLAATLGALIGISMVTLLFPPTMFSIEGLSSTYTKSLPLTKKTLVAAKVTLSTLSYIISMIALFAVALYFRRDYTYVLTYGSMHTLSVAAASMIEVKIMTDKFWKEGTAMGNLYSRLSTFILVLLPGYAIAWIPIIAAFAAFFLESSMVPAVFLTISLLEFVVMTLAAFHEKKRK